MPDPEHVLVSIGRDNAIAVYKYTGLTNGGPEASRDRMGPDAPLRSRVCCRPTGTPSQVQPDPALGSGEIVVTNARGIGDRGPQAKICKGPETSPATECAKGYNTYDETGTLTTFKMPAERELAQYTKTVFTDNDWNNVPAINSGAGDTVPDVIPRKIGGHSPIKHVFVIVKENRTYDQVLGDLGRATATPNWRSSARRSLQTRTRWPSASATSTTSTTRGRCRPTATTGSCRPRPTTTSKRSSGRSTAPIPPKAATRSPTSATASSGTRPRRRG